MNILLIIADTFEFIGGIMIAFTAITVNHRFLSEHKINEKVFREMRREQRIGILGVIMLTVGFFLNFAVLIVSR